MWFFVALLAPIFHGFANILDGYFINNIFKRASTLNFFSNFLSFLFLPIIILFFPLEPFPFALIPFVLLIGLIDVLYAIPYYKALQEEDTSVITALFSIGKFFVPILAFFLLGERLAPIQYAGFLLIIIASMTLGIDRKKRFKVSKAFFYMFIASLLLALEVVIYKYLFESVGWSTGFVWSVTTSFLMVSILLFFKKTRNDITESFGRFKKAFSLFIVEEFCTFAGTAAGVFAVALAPVTLVEGVGETQAIIVVLYALFLGKIFPKIFKEKVDIASLQKKLILFVIMVIGVFLTLR